jgi:O-antigen/teichoic acid export membrane protein
MIGVIIADKSEVGYYEQSQKIVKLLMTLATSLGTVMMPRIASTFASGNKEKIREYMDNSFAFIMMLAFPLMYGVISISSKFVPLFYGNGYEKVAPLICITSPIIVLIGLSNVTGTQYLLPTKQQNKYTLSVVVGAIVNFLLNLLLIKKYASIGAAIATVVAELSVTITQFVLIRKNIKIIDVLTISYKYIISSNIMFICSTLIGYLVNDNLLSIILQVIVSCLVYILCLILLKDKFLLENLSKIKAKFIKKHKSA